MHSLFSCNDRRWSFATLLQCHSRKPSCSAPAALSTRPRPISANPRRGCERASGKNASRKSTVTIDSKSETRTTGRQQRRLTRPDAVFTVKSIAFERLEATRTSP
ncbi:hypothetical protein SKAU_G00186240 [Synaphobranchus kaupii]|uniref:Uncharacterized protein n=1 Tax=Synaphobranchus kaupii TaxID=118154 RepID=A0A9Q1FCJ7_SYNKA|nr:hypothetical protein SKAU_G00186240 [Synaphobranchus kaupii]